MNRTGKRRVFQGAVALFLACAAAWAGGGPQNTLIVVNDNSLESLELGQYYQAMRGIPEANICHIRVATNYSVNTAAFSNDIRGPILSFVTDSVLSNQIDYIVFSMGIPYKVSQGGSTNGLTAAMFYGFKTNAVPPCSPATSYSRSDYWEAERSFVHSASPSSNRYYLSTILAATNLGNAKQIIDRSVTADYSQPTGTLYFLHTLDPRNIQWFQFENEDFMARFLDIPQQRSFRDGYVMSGQTDVVGLMIGEGAGSDLMSGNEYLKGALADHLTSYGGTLYEPGSGQASIVRWLEYGCVGSYGTVVEPCANTNKFSDPRVHYWYGRGFNMGESYWMSLRNPYEGVFIGEPLCAPYAKQPSVSVSGIASNQVVTNNVAITITAVSISTAQPVDQVDLFLDGVILATPTNVTPRTSNVVAVAINLTNCTYVVPAGATFFTAATGLAEVINASNLGVTAAALGDRVQIRQNAMGVSGGWLTCVATSSAGVAGEQTLFAQTPFTNFLETTYRAQRRITLSGMPVSGDIVRLVVSNLAGGVFTNQAVSDGVTNNSPYLLLSNLACAVNADTNLQNAQGCEMKWVYNASYFYGGTPVHDAYLLARTNTWEGYNLYTWYTVSTQPGSTLSGPDASGKCTNNSGVLSARATVFLSEGRTNLVGAYSLNTATLADGPHELMAVAYEGTAVRSQGRVKIPFIVNNHTASCTITSPADQASFLLGTSVTVYVSASAAGGGSVSTVQCYVEGKLLAATGTAPYVFTFSATNYGVGTVGIQALSVSSNGDAVLSANVDVLILPDYDFDGVDDAWETSHFGSITNWGAWDDPDTDGVYNVNEYIADTQPTSTASKFTAWIYWQTNGGARAEVDFGSSTARQYWIHYLENPLDATPAWLIGSNALTGTGGTSVWYDDGTDLPAPTGSYRFYRVRVLRP